MPYETVFNSVGVGVLRLAKMKEAGLRTARVVPWLQAFNAPWVDRTEYGVSAAEAQIRLVHGIAPGAVMAPRRDEQDVEDEEEDDRGGDSAREADLGHVRGFEDEGGDSEECREHGRVDSHHPELPRLELSHLHGPAP